MSVDIKTLCCVFHFSALQILCNAGIIFCKAHHRAPISLARRKLRHVNTTLRTLPAKL